jgi:hypothetical protein
VSRGLAVLGIVLGFVLAGPACKKSADPVVARLEEMTSQVERMPKAQAPWKPAKVGNTFVIGSAVRTGADSHAKLRVGTKGKLEVDASSIVYFTRTPGRERNDLRVEAGVAELETGDEMVGIGEAVLDPNTRARVEATPEGTTLVVTVGRAVLEDNEIAAGERVTLGPAGRPIPKVTAADAGVAQPRPGTIAVAVRDKPVRIKTESGERELQVGEHEIEAGASATVPEGGTLEVMRDGARAVTSGPSELRIGEGSILVAVAKGNVTLRGDTTPATATVPGGTVTADPGAVAGIAVAGKDTAIDGQLGTTTVESPKGKQTLTGGQSATLAGSGEIVVLPPPPSRTVASIAAGESATLHDPKAPTPLHITFGDTCPSGGVVEIARDRHFKKLVARSGGLAAANILAPAGTFSYRVRCPGGRGATGTLRILKDSGRTPLPKAAARTAVEMDGREYTILYQNLLPELTLTWRTAPRGRSRYTFVVKPAKGAERRLVGTSPTMQLVAGEVREGSYKVWVEPDAGSRSEESRIVIEFDNAAKSASIDSVDASGSTIRVKGTVIESSTVSAGGTPVELDRHRRFTAALSPGPNEDGASVRIAHRKAGIHYYVMRPTLP